MRPPDASQGLVDLVIHQSSNGKRKKEDYRKLAINLQRAEADLMINKVCKRISIERPEIFITTIHDSILTTEENKSYICNVILNEFERNFNLKPSLKIE